MSDGRVMSEKEFASLADKSRYWWEEPETEPQRSLLIENWNNLFATIRHLQKQNTDNLDKYNADYETWVAERTKLRNRINTLENTPLVSSVVRLERQVQEYEETDLMIREMASNSDRFDINPYPTFDAGEVGWNWTVEVMQKNSSIAISEGKESLREAVKEAYAEYIERMRRDEA